MVSVRIRLYRIHDYDLYVLYFSRSFDFTKAVKTSLRSYTKQDGTKIKVKKEDIAFPVHPKKSISTVINFNEKTDKKVIELIYSVDKWKRNMFIKNILRSRLSGMEYFYFYNSEKIPVFDTVENITEESIRRNRDKTEETEENEAMIDTYTEPIEPKTEQINDNDNNDDDEQLLSAMDDMLKNMSF